MSRYWHLFYIVFIFAMTQADPVVHEVDPNIPHPTHITITMTPEDIKDTDRLFLERCATGLVSDPALNCNPADAARELKNH